MNTYLVTGASGQLGQQVLKILLERGEKNIIATTRKPFEMKGVDVRQADFDDPASLEKAFAGATHALLISTDGLGKRAKQHKDAVAAFKKAGVKHITYTSLSKTDDSLFAVAPEHIATEKVLEESGLDFVSLRNNIYSSLLLQVLPGAVKSGQLIDARGTGKVAYVTHEDCARTAAGALLAAPAGKHYVEVSGPTAVSSEELAAIASEVTGKPVKHLNVPMDALIQGMISHGLPQPVAELYGTLDLAVSKNQMDAIGDGVKRFTGKEPESLRSYLQANKTALLS